MKDTILLEVNSLVADFLYSDRKEDEDLPNGAIETAIDKGQITEDEIVQRFREQLHKGLGGK